MGRSMIRLVLALLLLLSAAQTAHALYQWVDDKGNLHITDNPPPGKAVPEPEPASEPAAKPAPAPGSAAPAAATRPAATSPAAPAPKPSILTLPAVAPAVTAPKTATVPSATAAPAQPPAPAPTGMTAPGPAAQPAPAPRPSPFPMPASPQAPSPNAIAAFVAGFLLIFLAIGVVVYLYYSFCLYKIAQKTGFEAAWAAWIPIIQVWPMLGAAGKPLWWLLLFFIPLVNIVVAVYVWMCISENVGKNKWLGLLILLPIANLILPGYLAFSKSE